MVELIIIGGGPAGYHAAGRAAAAGWETVLVEKNLLGGVCLNEGCIPSKTILHSAKLYSQAKHSDAYGVTAAEVSFDLDVVMKRKQKIMDTLRKGIAAGLKKQKVKVVAGHAVISGPIDGGFAVAVGDDVYEGKRLLLCSGSEAIRPPIPGADQPFVMTNREVLSIAKLPETMTVIGGGVIGLELATFFAETGTKVTVVEMLDHIAGETDQDISNILKKEMEKKGVVFQLGCRVTAVGDHEVTYEDASGKQTTAAAEVVLMSIGRRAVSDGCGYESIGLALERGAVVTDERCRTNVPHVWAAGDINGRSMLAHTAYREADVAVADMRGGHKTVNYRTVPGVIYTHPEVACVGLTEAEAGREGIDVRVAKLPMSFNGRYQAENEKTRGQIKVVLDRERNTVLGVHMVGGACSEMIFGAVVLIEDEFRVEDIDDLVFPHPTVSENIKDALVH